ncbi:hypothetical protein BJ138DRAFT_1112849 [Hygrophoropsis aurantiaca]|uniref:Uncharacterized protein n=1 Tax=Hygrophoropsis aurantiaca TaxID=72124 RepID=A0ACB8AEW3_9AGAM|nr:hypothetical protein BJ138DRAFT_1112849 [Hygrophoropsis aurantiaca]
MGSALSSISVEITVCAVILGALVVVWAYIRNSATDPGVWIIIEPANKKSKRNRAVTHPKITGRKTTFKAYAVKESLAISRNKAEFCQYCGVTRATGAKPFPVCSGCHSVRFCCREHQMALWPQHKLICKEQKRNAENIQRAQEADDISAPPGFPPIQECKCLLEDWVEVHCQGIQQSIADAIENLDHPYDIKKECFVFEVSYVPSSGGNPSLAFAVTNAEIISLPSPGTSMGDILATAIPRVLQGYAEQLAHPMSVGAVPCIFNVDNVFVWLSFTHIALFDTPMISFVEGSWYWWLNYCARRGLIFRTNASDNAIWHPGLMEKEGNKWVWRKKSLAQLGRKGIHLEHYPAHTRCPYVLAVLRDLYP